MCSLKANLTTTALVFSLLFINTTVLGQFTIRGKIKTETGAAMANATVLLLQTKDSSLIKALVCDKAGTYAFKNITGGSYLISATLVGYKQGYSVVNVTAQSPGEVLVDLQLTPEDAVLKDVVVTTKKPLFQQKIDRLVINVAASITSAGNTALEVLERSPGVMVDRQNNTIAMNGKDGVVVMINGRISYMPTAAIVQMLSGMNAGNIEKIELITTPPANMDAAGNAGYINIVLKENNNFGTNGSFSGTVGYGKGWVTEVTVNINHRRGRVNLYGDFSYSRTKKPIIFLGNNKISNAGIITETNFKNDRVETRPTINARMGVDIDLNKKNILGFLFSGYDSHYSQSEHNLNTITKNGALDTAIHFDNSEINHWSSYSGNINFQHTFQEDSKLLINADYIHYYNNQPVNYFSTYYNKSNAFVYDQSFRSGKKTPIDFWVGAIDYSKKLTKRLKMDAGFKQTVSSFNNDVSFERLQQAVWVKDNSLSATYVLKENYTAAYTSLDINIDSTTDAKAGLRYEYTNSNLSSLVKKNIVDRHYGNFFPSLFLSHKLRSGSTIDASYSRRITRPSFSDLAPFTYYANANTVITGNSALQPSISDNFRVGYTFSKYMLAASYSFEKEAITGFQPTSDSVTNKTVLTPQNLINQKTVALLFSVPITITSWWSMQYNLTGVWQQINALYKTDVVRINQANFMLNGTQRFTLPKDFSIELSGFYFSKRLDGIFTGLPFGSLDVGVRKKLSGNGGSFVLNATNILNTFNYHITVDLPEQNLSNQLKINFSQPTLKLTYTRNFGKEKLKERRAYSTSADDERGRVRS